MSSSRKMCMASSGAFSVLLITLCCLLLQCAAGIKDDSVERSRFEESNEIVYTPEEIENIVSFGEDCSSEGPFCDARQHLACDKEEEICVCDDKNGYVYVGNLDSSETELLEDNELGIFDDQYRDGREQSSSSSSKKLCMKSSHLEHKLDRLLNITKKIRDFAEIFKKYKKYLPKKYQDLLKEEL